MRVYFVFFSISNVLHFGLTKYSVNVMSFQYLVEILHRIFVIRKYSAILLVGSNHNSPHNTLHDAELLANLEPLEARIHGWTTLTKILSQFTFSV